MPPAISASDLTLRQVKQQFSLVQVNGTTIAEWQPPFPDPSDLERQVLDRVQTSYELYTVLSILKRMGATLLP
ncbi:hypothetical protein [Egbenema bharatensis]|uniref:hypothetical protein n=1 Tax=Egbenema bharatensis TaxID=3463334 RepID=UPI003A84669D